MGFQRNTISAEEHKERSLKLLENGINNKQDLNELFFLYNDVMTPRKTDSFCGRCRNEVLRRLKLYYGIN